MGHHHAVDRIGTSDVSESFCRYHLLKTQLRSAMTSPFISLGQWYAAPLSPEQAAAIFARVEAKERERLRRGASCVTCRVAMLIARFWLGEWIESDYQGLISRFRKRHSPRAQVLLELTYGQLLAARRRRGAMAHLERGFAEGRHLFAPGDYFIVLKRHVLLRLLPADGEGPPLDLDDLLTMARVIERLQGGAAGRSR